MLPTAVLVSGILNSALIAARAWLLKTYRSQSMPFLMILRSVLFTRFPYIQEAADKEQAKKCVPRYETLSRLRKWGITCSRLPPSLVLCEWMILILTPAERAASKVDTFDKEERCR